MTVILKNTNTGKEREFETVPEAKEQRQKLIEIGATPEELELRENGTATAQADGGNTDGNDTPDVVEADTDATEALPDEPPVGTDLSKGSMNDPLKTLPEWMITKVSYSDRGDTTTTVNKRGCQVIANYLGLETETEAITRASESEFEFAEFKATVTKPDGREYTGHGTARADGQDQGENDGWKLDMQAETRAYKRAVKAATGGGIEAFNSNQ
jgi:hypothetical protein